MSMSVEPDSYYKYWGKTKHPNDVGDDYHLLVYHLLDVAAVGYELLSQDAKLCNRLSTLTCIPEAQLPATIAQLLSLHDIGKFSERFQGLDLEVQKKLTGRECTKPYSLRHDRLGLEIYNALANDSAGCYDRPVSELLEAASAISSELDTSLLESVFGHHGKPTVNRDVAGSFEVCDHFRSEDIDALYKYLDARPAVLRAHAIPSFAHEATSSWVLAGLIVLCDWLGSNSGFFPMCSRELPLEAYWEETRARAAHAIKHSGIVRKPCATSSIGFGFSELTPLQQYARDVALPSGPSLHILEDMTGAGKTEAAIILAQRLLQSNAADGLFFALPTMATSNAMFKRVDTIANDLFTACTVILAHSKNKLLDSFLEMVAEVPFEKKDYSTAADGSVADSDGAVSCSSWLVDNRKKCLLADIGVGTIDQVLMAVLRSKFQTLRMFGLFGKVLIVDEVHANDAYMHKVLRTVLEFHASWGGSAILLSATLPKKMRAELLQSFSDGEARLEREPRKSDGVGLMSRRPVRALIPELSDAQYPLATCFTTSSLVETALTTREGLARSVAFKLVHAEEEMVEQISLVADRAVCWIRNTVDDAVRAYRLLKERGDFRRVILFHARFAMCDRLDIEDEVLSVFGKAGKPSQRNGTLLIATQVVEQSLDLDFDFLFTDLAPIDSIFQRAGRARRHTRAADGAFISRADERGMPSVTVLAPSQEGTPKADWYKALFEGGAYVYPNTLQLWRTASYLQEHGHVHFPEDLREAIELVYSEEPPEAGLEAFQKASNETSAQESVAKSAATQNTVKPDKGYDEGWKTWLEDTHVVTRLGQESVMVRLATWDGEKLHPYCQGQNYRWELSEVSLSLGRIKRINSDRSGLVGNVPEEAIVLAKKLMPGGGKWAEIAVIGEARGLTYSKEMGVEWSA